MRTLDIAARNLAQSYVAWRNAQERFGRDCLANGASAPRSTYRERLDEIGATAEALAVSEDAYRRAMELAQ